jgi:hypothetical protein
MGLILRTGATLLVALAVAQGASAQDRKLDAAARTSAIEGVLRRLNADYIFPDVARKMEQAVRERAARGEYDSITDGNELAIKLTNDLREVSHDLHIRVGYSPDVLPPEPKERLAIPPEMVEQFRRDMARDNFGFERVEVLKGNVGYIKINLFTPPEFAADTYAAAMAYVANTDALIIDLRDNGGSISVDAVPMLCTYFFESPVHLYDLYWRPEDMTRQIWTWGHVPGKRYLNKPIYVLTSRKTFSGAEEFAYDLKHLKRVTIVGETTGGGANPGGDRRADDHFTVWVPFGRAINPITKANWEGTGVTPDIAVPAAKALLTARLTALKQLEAGAKDERWTNVLRSTVAETEQELAKFKPVTFTLKGYPDAKEVAVAGSFNSWSTRSNLLTRKGDAWVGEFEAEPGPLAYKFVIDGQWIMDPANPATERVGEYMNSVIVVE